MSRQRKRYSYVLLSVFLAAALVATLIGYVMSTVGDGSARDEAEWEWRSHHVMSLGHVRAVHGPVIERRASYLTVRLTYACPEEGAPKVLVIRYEGGRTSTIASRMLSEVRGVINQAARTGVSRARDPFYVPKTHGRLKDRPLEGAILALNVIVKGDPGFLISGKGVMIVLPLPNREGTFTFPFVGYGLTSADLEKPITISVFYAVRKEEPRRPDVIEGFKLTDADLKRLTLIMAMTLPLNSFIITHVAKRPRRWHEVEAIRISVRWKLWLLAVIAYGFGDLLTTYMALKVGGMEFNPIMTFIIGPGLDIINMALFKGVILINVFIVSHVVSRELKSEEIAYTLPFLVALVGAIITAVNVLMTMIMVMMKPM